MHRKKIDLTKHSGHHPRIGAVDVVPIVPLIGVNFEEANYLVEKLSQKKFLMILIYQYTFTKNLHVIKKDKT